jgi:hypothetical protein
MEHVRGKLVAGEEVLHENLDIALILIESPTGLKQYRDCFQLAQGPTGLNAEGPFQLDLEDGRSGASYGPRIELRPSGIKISFTLAGALRQREP